MTIVSITLGYLAHTGPTSIWYGGSFGMYSTFHTNSRRIYAKVKTSKVKSEEFKLRFQEKIFDALNNEDANFGYSLRTVVYNPNRKNLGEISRYLFKYWNQLNNELSPNEKFELYGIKLTMLEINFSIQKNEIFMKKITEQEYDNRKN